MASSVFIGYFGGSKISYDGSAVTFADRILAPDGTAAAPSYSFASDPDSGFYSRAPTNVGLVIDGTPYWEQSGNNFRFKSDAILSWTAGAAGSAPDTSLSRGAANRLTLAAGDAFNLAPTAFASLPTGAEGNLACVTDSNTATWGATIAGGGANNVLAFHNGTNWVVAGA